VSRKVINETQLQATKRTRRTRQKAAHAVDERKLSSAPSQICLQMFPPMRSNNAILQSSILDPELRQGQYQGPERGFLLFRTRVLTMHSKQHVWAPPAALRRLPRVARGAHARRRPRAAAPRRSTCRTDSAAPRACPSCSRDGRHRNRGGVGWGGGARRRRQWRVPADTPPTRRDACAARPRCNAAGRPRSFETPAGGGSGCGGG